MKKLPKELTEPFEKRQKYYEMLDEHFEKYGEMPPEHRAAYHMWVVTEQRIPWYKHKHVMKQLRRAARNFRRRST